jgi:hypothetical protein
MRAVMNATSILSYVAWHLGIRPEQMRSPARITYMGSQREKAPAAVSATDAATVETAKAEGQP